MWLLILKILSQVIAVGAMFLICLLDYVYRDKRTRPFKNIRYFLFIISGIFLVVGIIVVVLDDMENNERFSRLSQPINNIYISFIIEIPITRQALNQYHQCIKSSIDEIYQSRVGWLQTLKSGAYVGTTDRDGSVNTIVIPPKPEIFPKNESEPVAYPLLNSAGLVSNFIKVTSIFCRAKKCRSNMLPKY